MCLQWLVLSYNDIGPAGGEAIAKGLQASLPKCTWKDKLA